LMHRCSLLSPSPQLDVTSSIEQSITAHRPLRSLDMRRQDAPEQLSGPL
jgi:hypothetical protein